MFGNYRMTDLMDKNDYLGILGGFIVLTAIGALAWVLGYGFGGEVALGTGFGLFVLLYAFQPGIQSYGTAFLLGIIGAALFIFAIESFLPFGQILANLVQTQTLAGELGGGVPIAGTDFILPAFALWYVKVPDMD